jgi:hypothetical protein
MCGHCPSLGPSDTGCGLGLAPRSPVRLCGWRDQSPGWWALRLLESGVYAVLSGCAAGQLLAHTFMANSCGDDMTKPNFLRGSSSDSCFLRTRQTPLITCLSGQWECGHCPHSVHGRLVGLHFDLLLLALPSLLHEVFCFRRHDFAAWIFGFLGSSGVSGNVFGVSMAGIESIDRVQVCGIPTFFRAVLVWLIRHTCPNSTARPSTCLSEPALQRP